MLGKTKVKRSMGWQGMRSLNSIPDSVDMNLSKFWEIVEDSGLSMLQSMRSQRVWQDFASEQQQQNANSGSFAPSSEIEGKQDSRENYSVVWTVFYRYFIPERDVSCLIFTFTSQKYTYMLIVCLFCFFGLSDDWDKLSSLPRSRL